MISVTSCDSQHGVEIYQAGDTYTRIIWLKQSNLDSLFLEVSLGLGQVQRGVVRRSVPDIR
jgi:hypothetical protein